MDKDRRKQALQVKVQRLSDSIARARKDRKGLALLRISWLVLLFIFFLRVFHLTISILTAGVEKLMRTYSGNPSFSNQKNLEETGQQLDEVGDSVRREDTQKPPESSRLLLLLLLLPTVLSETGPPSGHALQAVCRLVCTGGHAEASTFLQKH